MSAQTDSAGVFRFPDLRAGDYVLRITFLGYAPAERRVTLPQNRPVEVIMEQANYMTEEVIVTASRASANSATAFTNIDKTYLEKQKLRQALPYRVNLSPSVVVRYENRKRE